MTGVTVVIVGLVRDEAMFDRSLAGYARLVAAGLVERIVVSTWTEELEERPGLVALCRKYGCQVVASPDPGIRLVPGLTSSLAPQSIGLRQALGCIPDDGMVLKTRPDLVFDQDFLGRLLIRAQGPEFDAAPGSPLKKRIWVPWADFLFPFFIADECFLGRCGDLRRLTGDWYRTYRPGAAIHPNLEHCHVLRHLAPFYAGVFRDFHKNWPYLQYELPVLDGGWQPYCIVKFHTRMYWVLVAKYVAVLCDSYLIDGGRAGDITFFVKSGDRNHRTKPSEICHFMPGGQIPVALDPRKFIDNVMAVRGRVLILNDMTWLRNVRYGGISGDGFYDGVFCPAMLQMEGFEARGEVPDLGAAIRETLRNERPDTDFSSLSGTDWQVELGPPERG
jgi:hypothetical protein